MIRSIRQKKILIGITGSISAYKACELVREFIKVECDVTVLMTPEAVRFVTPLTFEALTHHHVFTDPFGSATQSAMDHIELARTSDLFIIAPATAHMIGKLASGLADDIISITALASSSPILVAPAMNVHMWSHNIVRQNLETLKKSGYKIVNPEKGDLACGDTGYGRLASIESIVREALKLVRVKSA